MQQGPIAAHVTESHSVTSGDVLFEVETEKVTDEEQAPGDGILLEILVPAGEVGRDVCVVEGND